MLANNEIGVVQPIAEIGAAIKATDPEVLFHCDAVQGVGKIPFDVEEAKVDLVSISAHKMYGPKGIGALWVRRKPRVRLDPLIDGGGHERGMRSGTLAVPLIVGFGMAAELCHKEMAEEAAAHGPAARPAAPRHPGRPRPGLRQRLARAPPAPATSTSRSPSSRASRC